MSAHCVGVQSVLCEETRGTKRISVKSTSQRQGMKLALSVEHEFFTLNFDYLGQGL